VGYKLARGTKQPDLGVVISSIREKQKSAESVRRACSRRRALIPC
jgi:hypothetical protein